jgi:flagellar biosynthesis/type III secretory pathway M-ring protein FliF/YscJ
VSRDRSAARQRLAEVLLWAAVGLCGYFVLIPAAAELLRARQLEAEEAEKGETARDLAEEAERDLDWAHNDPLTDRRVQETPGQDLRKYRAEKQQGTTQ